jgi:hypothetical protein
MTAERQERRSAARFCFPARQLSWNNAVEQETTEKTEK